MMDTIEKAVARMERKRAILRDVVTETVVEYSCEPDLLAMRMTTLVGMVLDKAIQKGLLTDD